MDNKKIIIFAVSIVILSSVFVIFLINSIIESETEVSERKEIEENELLSHLNKDVKGDYNSANEDFQGENKNTFEEMMDGVLSLEDASDKHPDHFGLTFYEYDEEKYNQIIKESINLFNQNEIEEGIKTVENHLMFVSEKNNEKIDEIRQIRDDLNSMQYMYTVHGLEYFNEDESYNEELDFAFMKTVGRVIPMKEYVLPYYLNINHRVMVELIASGESLAPIVLDSNTIEYGEVVEYKGHDYYQIEASYGKGARAYQQDFKINEQAYTAVIVGDEQGHFLWRVTYPFNEIGIPTKSKETLTEKTVSEWRKYYKEVLKHETGGILR